MAVASPTALPRQEIVKTNSCGGALIVFIYSSLRSTPHCKSIAADNSVLSIVSQPVMSIQWNAVRQSAMKAIDSSRFRFGLKLFANAEVDVSLGQSVG